MPRKRLKGKVVSDKMEKTVVVAVERVFAHPVYKKRIKAIRRFKAHDETGAKVGDEVVIEETKPISKEKRWRVVEIGGKPIGKQQTANSEQQKRGHKQLAVSRKRKARPSR